MLIEPRSLWRRVMVTAPATCRSGWSSWPRLSGCQVLRERTDLRGREGTTRSHRPVLVCRHRGRTAECRSEEHTSELQSLMRISYAVFCLNKKKKNTLVVPSMII